MSRGEDCGRWESEWLRLGNAVREVAHLRRARLFVFGDGVAIGFVAAERSDSGRECDFKRLLGEFLLRSYGNGHVRDSVRAALRGAGSDVEQAGAGA